MRIIALVAATVILVCVAMLFALNNMQVVAVDLIVVRSEMPVAYVVAGAVFLGLILGVLLTFFLYLKVHWQLMRAKQQNKHLSKRLASSGVALKS
ncbi:MAG: hypothetical protein CMF25_02070 [Kangiellaceae bacterium]|jgi:uncharacterized membrane protein YciS (DUF1049 family)|nr:hypothetical protein [Kangiellaceae bacterium]|tara:strand:+ start:14570 stop:14854 length:285 start_codon:yes stop_codon:yes gene_type:complete